MKNIVVVGLGLIGGSLASALKGFEGYTVMGVDNDRDIRLYAEEKSIADIVTDDTKYAVAHGDIVFCCLHPHGILEFLQAHKQGFLPGALVTDVCGVKSAVLEAAKELPDTVDFIGSHPMAGKERGGIQNSSKTLFRGAHYIITPRKESKPENIALLERIAAYIGARDVIQTEPERHDAVIAYTSQMMHIIAAAICDAPNLFDCQGFEGGSFRDCTRVAALEPELWTQLLSMNAAPLTETLRRFEDNLRAYREVIEARDDVALMKKLRDSSERKKRMHIEYRRGDDAVL